MKRSQRIVACKFTIWVRVESKEESVTMEYVFASFLFTTGVAAALTRIRRLNYQRNVGLNKIYPLEGELNELVITIDARDSLHVRTCENKRLHKVTKVGKNWHVQCASNKKNVSTIKNGVRDKYVVLTNSHHNRSSPLNTSPSVIKRESGLYEKLTKCFGTPKNTNFSFGSSIVLRWVGFEHFEIINKEKDLILANDSIDVHQRVARAAPVIGDPNSYSIIFDYNKINIEVLISTFITSLLLQSSCHSGHLNHKKITTHIV